MPRVSVPFAAAPYAGAPFAPASFLALLLVSALGAAHTLAAQDINQREADVSERVEWLLHDRAYPFGAGTFGTAERDAVSAARASALFRDARTLRGALAVPPWRSVGPFGFQTNGFYGSSPQADGGRIRAVAVDPRSAAVIYAGSASGGVWRTANGGASWTPLTDAQCALTTGAMALDPVDPSIIYVGTGEPTQSSGCGLLRSFDAGASWTEMNGGGVLAPTNGSRANQTYRVVVDRASAGTRSSTIVLYAASNGLHRSANSGTTWSTVLAGFVTDVRADPINPGTYWAAVGNSTTRGGIYKSTDRGASWSLVYAAPPGSGRIALALSATAPGKVWMATSNTQGNRLGTFRLYNDANGSAITLAAEGVNDPRTRLDFGAQTSYNLVLETHPTDSGVVFLGGSRMYRSRDSGQSFSLMAYSVHVDWHALQFAPSDPSVIVGGGDGGVHVSYDAGNSWVSRNTNIVVAQFYPGLGVHPSIPDVLVGGLQDNSTLWAFGSPYWSLAVSSGDGGAGGFNRTNPDVFWSTSYGVGSIFRMTRASVGFGLSIQGRGFSANDRKRFLPPFVLDPNDGNTLYYGTYRLWRSQSEGNAGTWRTISGDLTKGTGAINTIEVAPGDSRVIWVGTNDGNVHRSIDGGLTFTLVSNGLPNRAVTKVAADPLDTRRAIVTLSGFGTPHVFVTTDQGATWRDISGSLPDLPFNSAVIIPGTNRFFVAGDVGIYESLSGGETWGSAFPGIPNVQVLDLVFQPATGQLYAATYGRGIYATSVVTGISALRGDVNRDGTVNALDALHVQQALVGALPSSVPSPMPAADANCNGRLDVGDALAILQFAVGNAPPGACVGTVQ